MKRGAGSHSSSLPPEHGSFHIIKEWLPGGLLLTDPVICTIRSGYYSKS
ncbi:MAG: hypothetical protein ABRQ37_26720 [Candidatus Eremiobacterota bacterium]